MNSIGSLPYVPGPYVPGSGRESAAPGLVISPAAIAGHDPGRLAAPTGAPTVAPVTPPARSEALISGPGPALGAVIDFTALGQIFAKVRELLAPDRLAVEEQGAGPFGLTAQELREVAALRRIDSAVRQSEQDQAVRGVPDGDPPAYIYRLGPDGKLYAVAGSEGVGIPLGIGDPEALRQALAGGSQAPAPATPAARDPHGTNGSAMVTAPASIGPAGPDPASNDPTPDGPTSNDPTSNGPAGPDPRRRDDHAAAVGHLVDIFG